MIKLVVCCRAKAQLQEDYFQEVFVELTNQIKLTLNKLMSN